MGATALARGCVDLVIGGHLHVQVGPTRVVGENGKAGYSYTNGTTGGAAYAIALGSKLRRDAEVTLVTFAARSSGGPAAGDDQAPPATSGGVVRRARPRLNLDELPTEPRERFELSTLALQVRRSGHLS